MEIFPDEKAGEDEDDDSIKSLQSGSIASDDDCFSERRYSKESSIMNVVLFRICAISHQNSWKIHSKSFLLMHIVTWEELTDFHFLPQLYPPQW